MLVDQDSRGSLCFHNSLKAGSRSGKLSRVKQADHGLQDKPTKAAQANTGLSVLCMHVNRPINAGDHLQGVIGLSRPTLDRTINQLVKAGIVKEYAGRGSATEKERRSPRVIKKIKKGLTP